MKNFLLGMAAGVVAAAIYRSYTQKVKTAEKKPLTAEEKIAVVKEAVTDEANKYGAALRKQFTILLPSDLINKKVAEKGKEFTQRRYELREETIKPPVVL